MRRLLSATITSSGTPTPRFEACYADSKHAVRRRVQLKSDLGELNLIIFNASVKWELTAWPLMDMANVAVSTLVAGPR